jgi:hypothetical protein
MAPRPACWHCARSRYPAAVQEYESGICQPSASVAIPLSIFTSRTPGPGPQAGSVDAKRGAGAIAKRCIFLLATSGPNCNPPKPQTRIAQVAGGELTGVVRSFLLHRPGR